MADDVAAALEKAKKEQNLSLNGLEGGSLPFFLARLSRDQAETPILILTATEKEAINLTDDIAELNRGLSPTPRITHFPAPDTLPYTQLRPSRDIELDRLQALYHSLNQIPHTIVSSVAAALRTVLPKSDFISQCRTLTRGETIALTALIQDLVDAGYQSAPLVEEPGSLAKRGSILDLWSPLSEHPVRLELDDETIVSLRSFDPETQRTQETLTKVALIPARDINLSDRYREKALAKLKPLADAADMPANERRELAEHISERRFRMGMESLLPLFYDSTPTIVDYLPSDTVVIVIRPAALAEAEEELQTDLKKTHAESDHFDRMIAPTQLYIPLETLVKNGAKKIEINSALPRYSAITAATEIPPNFLTFPAAAPDKSGRIVEWISGLLQDRFRIILTCHTRLQGERLLDLFRWHGLAPTLSTEPLGLLTTLTQATLVIALSPFSRGFFWPSEKLAVIPETDLFGRKAKARHVTPRNPTSLLNLSDLNPGDPIVHHQHGIGRFLGLTPMEIQGVKNDFAILEYLGADKLYLPAYRLNLLQKYIGPGEGAPALDKLGGTRWTKAKQKVVKEIRTVAGELLKIYAARKLAAGFAFGGRDHHVEEFEAQFEFDETPDQERAIDDVLKDMQSEEPMDRLICGDVGYGKTEVAMRAAFRAVLDGKQVAVLVPTTILAFQHYHSFCRRFRTTATRIEMLSRFRSAAEQAEILAKLAKGEVEIIIGTHRLLSRDVRFFDLGLLVIDEEHRFGVTHKEKIRKLKATVDTLAMSATPIPRTLNMALAGIREISVIETPPVDRLAIRTFVANFDDAVIAGAIRNELNRGGQVFFVHNRVETIHGIRDRLTKIVPEAKFQVAHGQMNEEELEETMIAFMEKKFDVLLSTSIIESGLDIPSANTILINRADTFGLAALYQLRGRVGRSNLQAFAYLLIPEEGRLSATAERRLTALQRHTELGSGFSIAMHDLEIRGAGNLLGRAQHGHIAEIGYEMYSKLLERTIRRMRGETELTEIDPEIKIPVDAYLPATYIPDDTTRTLLYRRLAQLTEPDQVNEMAEEITDRFGPLPPEVVNLLSVIEIKVAALALKIEQVHYDGTQFTLKFNAATPVAPATILKLAGSKPKLYCLKPHNIVTIHHSSRDPAGIFSTLRHFLERIK